jgi:hypothetical protein
MKYVYLWIIYRKFRVIVIDMVKVVVIQSKTVIIIPFKCLRR